MVRKMGVCAVDGCGPKLIQARGLCATHYSRLRYHGDPLWEPPAPGRPCAVEGCNDKHYCKSYCVKHYNRWQKHGDVHANPRVYAGPECIAPDCIKEPTDGRYCSAHRARLTRLGTTELPVRAGRHEHSMGYQIVKRPRHPVARDPRGWVYEHRVVLFDAIGPGWHPCQHCGMQVSWELTYPEHPDALVVDHLDEDRTNNDRDNLVPSCAPCNFARSSRWKKARAGGASQ